MAPTGKLNWEIFSAEERNSAIQELKDSIAGNDGFITNFNLFSDLALSLQIEIEEKNVLNLYRKIDSTMRISEQEPDFIDNNSIKDWWIFINLSFTKGKGDLEVEVPNVPG